MGAGGMGRLGEVWVKLGGYGCNGGIQMQLGGDMGAMGGIGVQLGGIWVQEPQGALWLGVALSEDGGTHGCPSVCPPAEFSIWTREAGAGGLSIAVEGPSKAEIAFEDRKDGSCGVSYLVQEPGGSQGVVCVPSIPDTPTPHPQPQGCAQPRAGGIGTLTQGGTHV